MKINQSIKIYDDIRYEDKTSLVLEESGDIYLELESDEFRIRRKVDKESLIEFVKSIAFDELRSVKKNDDE